MTTLPLTPMAYTLKHASELTRLSRTALYDAIRDKKLKAKKYGSRTLVLHDDLQAFVLSLPAKAG